MVLSYTAFRFMRESRIVAVHLLSREVATCDGITGCCEFTERGIVLCRQHETAVSAI